MARDQERRVVMPPVGQLRVVSPDVRYVGEFIKAWALSGVPVVWRPGLGKNDLVVMSAQVYAKYVEEMDRLRTILLLQETQDKIQALRDKLPEK